MTAEQIQEIPSYSVIDIPIEDIIEDPKQPRKIFNDLKELTNSINEKGLLQAIQVRDLRNGKFKIVDGHRRFRACKLAGKKTVKAEILDDLSEKDIREMQLIIHIQRKDLNPVEKAEALKEMIEKHGYTQELLSKMLGVSEGFVSQKLKLLDLSDDILQDLKDGKINETHALVLSHAEPELRKDILELVKTQEMTAKETKNLLQMEKSVHRVNQPPQNEEIRGLVLSLPRSLYTALEKKATEAGLPIRQYALKLLEGDLV